MARRRPPHPWRDLPCAADDLFEFTGALLRGDVDAIVGAIASPASVVDLLVARHRLGPLLATRAADAAWMGKLPPATNDRIRATHERQRLVADRCLALLDAIDVECRTAALPFLIVRGPAMALHCYGDIAARGYWDLDIMVAEGDLARMESLLERIGAFRLSRTVLGRNLSTRFHHAFDYERDGVRLDLHWCMSRLPGVRFDGAAGFCMRVGCWHEFPFALEDGTDIAVVLRTETYRNLANVVGDEASGDDLDKKNLRRRAGRAITIDV